MMMKTLNSFFPRRRGKPADAPARVRVSEDGFAVTLTDGSSEEVRWAEVERVFAYKVDCFVYDMIWLAFERAGRETVLQISEEAEGFVDLMLAMNKAFPGIDQEWYQKVMLPAFAENLTLIFERAREA